MEAVPADIGDWGLGRVFYEGGRLLRKHFGEFLPIIIAFIFPASLIKVLYTQFYVEDFVGHQGSTDSEPHLIVSLLLDFVYKILFIFGYVGIRRVGEDNVYVCDSETKPHPKCFCATVKLAFDWTKTARTDIESAPPHKSPLTRTKWTFFKAFVALIVCLVLFIIVSLSGINFTPEAIAAMGLPSPSIFVFTALIAPSTALVTSYGYVMVVVVSFWLSYPDKPILR